MSAVSEAKMTEPEEGVRLTAEQIRRRKSRNVAIAVCLVVLVGLFYVITVAKLGANVFNRPL